MPHAELYLVSDTAYNPQRTNADEAGRFAFETAGGAYKLSVRRSSDDDYLDDDDRIVHGGERNVRVVLP